MKLSHFINLIYFSGNNPMEMEFDLIGIDPSLANSLRRIMISDVPSMAIEKVFIYNNTSIIQVHIKEILTIYLILKIDRYVDWLWTGKIAVP